MLRFRRFLLVVTIPVLAGGCGPGPNPDLLEPVPSNSGPIQSSDLSPVQLAPPSAGQPGVAPYPPGGAGMAQSPYPAPYPATNPPGTANPPQPGFGAQPDTLQAQANGQNAASQPLGASGGAPQVAMAAPGVAGGDFNPKSIGGTWSLAASGEGCFVALTQTSTIGGSRATPLRCTSDELKSIAAWSVDAGQMVLKNKNGDVVVRLNPAGQKRFNGTTAATRRQVVVYQAGG